ncbi:S-locus F-box protein type-1 [Solanum lycopersicum]|uniref:S-locus F-box protein type-1 n=2 Tax=Solanum subgen. Lycopersicon TaxID=49274 RepID=K4AVI6_SOLLC|nr:S-locus F-box protein type-1 [Solanum lycopersicum]AIG62957.1 S-locus F-box protein type-1 [Solanum lycopersicum]AIG62969.1 S-locus F-box protein type-1 [Solanum habrochaites]
MENVEEKRMELLDELMIDILKRLPAKSLIRLKCVSKSLYSLINNPDFIFIHYNYDSFSNQFIFLKRYIEIEESTSEYSIYYNGKNMLALHSNDESFKCIAENIEYEDNYIGVNVAGVCNGILCICSYRGIVLYNPTLREFWKLLPSNLPLLDDLCPSKKINCCVDLATGIGFDTNTNDYKVVRILDPSNEFEDFDINSKFISKVEIYNLSTNCWRRLKDLECIIDSLHCSRVLFNRAYYWHGYLNIGHNCIVSFDFSTESFQKHAYPEDFDGNRSESLSVLNQNIALIYYSEFYSPDLLVEQSIDIWIMKRESWVMEFTVGPMLIKKLLLVWKNGTELMIESKEGKLVSCNFFFQSTKELHMSGVQNTLEAFVCKQSLISIKKESAKWS